MADNNMVVLTPAKLRKRVITNAVKEGKEAFPVTAMGVAFVQAALR